MSKPLPDVATANDLSSPPPSALTTAPAAPSLTQQASSGFVWALTQTVGLKILGIVGQIALAKVLAKEHFGVVALALALTGLVQILQWTGVQDVLIKRQRRFLLWATPAFWLSMSIGVAISIILLAAAPIVYREKDNVVELTWLIAICLSTNLVALLGVVPQAYLQAQLAFRAVVVPATIVQAGIMLLSVGLAAAGMGPYSLVLPQLVFTPILTFIYWRRSGLRIRMRPHLRRWKYLVGDSATLLGIAAAGMIAGAAVSVGLEHFHDDAEVGVYTMGYNMSQQTLQLITGALTAVLFPSLARLHDDPKRMLGGFVRAARMLAIVGIPMCFLQAAVSRPGFELVFGAKWERAIPVTQLLSIGLAFAVLSGVASSLFKAQGRFGALLWWTIGISIVQIGLVGTGAWLGDSRAVALSVLCFYLCCGPAGAWLGLRPIGGGLREIWLIYGPPSLLSAVAVGAAWLVGSMMPTGTWPWRIANIGAVSLVAGLLYVPLVRVVAPTPWAELVQRIAHYLPANFRDTFVRLALPASAHDEARAA